jgi:LysM repeat protein
VIASHFQGPPYPWDSYLDGIRNRFGRSRENLQSWNGIANPNLIYAGQKIYVDPPGNYSGEQRVN